MLRLFVLFYGYRFCKIAGLIHIQILSKRGIIRNQLENYCNGEDRKNIFHIRDSNMEICQRFVHDGGLFCQKNDKSAPGLYFPHIGNYLGKDVLLSGDGDDTRLIRNQGDGSVL